MKKNNSSYESVKEKESGHRPTYPLESFEILYNSYAGKIHHKCLMMINDDEAAKDFTQDIFLKVFSKLHTFQSRAAFSTWLYAIAHNYCLDQLRINKRFYKESISDELIGELPDSENQEPLAAQLSMLEHLMSKLPSDQIQMLRLKHEHGLSVKAISEHYQISESAVKMRLKRTRHKLQTLCSSYSY